jgi:hypothetical protein
MDQVKSIVLDKLSLLRSKLDQIPALQDVEVSCEWSLFEFMIVVRILCF